MKIHHWCLFAAGVCFDILLNAKGVSFIMAFISIAMNLFAYFRGEKNTTKKQPQKQPPSQSIESSKEL